MSKDETTAEIGFEQIRIHSIEGEVDPNNLKSIKLLEKNGFSLKEKSENTSIYLLINPTKSK